MKVQNIGKLKKLALLGLLATVGMEAHAAPTCPETLDPGADYKCFYLNVGTDFDSDGNSVTSSVYELGYTGTLATSVYEKGLGNNSGVVDSNIKDVINYYGLSGGLTTYNDVSGGVNTVALKDTPDFPGEKNIDNLNGPAPSTEFFDANNTFLGSGWGLTYNYVFTGQLDPTTGPTYTGGYIDFIFQNWVDGTSEEVLRVDITNSTLSAANLDIYGTISFDWKGGALDMYGLDSVGDGTNDCTTALCQDFWNFQTLIPGNFYDLDGQNVQITMHLDTNVNPPVPELGQLVEFTGDDTNKYWIRQTTLDGSVRFGATIPEPGIVLLLGGGLLGLGMMRRKAGARI